MTKTLQPTVLVADDDAPLRALIRDALRDTARVLEAETGPAAAAALDRHAERGLALLLLGYPLPGAPGLELLSRAKTRWPSIPVVIMTGAGSEALVVEALRAGARDYLTKPLDLPRLVATTRVLAALGCPGGSPGTAAPAEALPLILVADDDAPLRALIRHALQDTARVLEAGTGPRALEDFGRHASRGLALLLLGYPLPESPDLDLLSRVKMWWPWIPVVIMTAAGSEELAIEALRAGARDYLTKPLDLQALPATVRVLAALGRSALRARRHIRVDRPALSPHPSGPLHPMVYRALAFVGAHFTEPLTLEEVARQASLSKCHFCRVFRQETGLTFRSYLRQLRIAHTKALLSVTRLDVTEIAYAVGFTDLSRFYKIFHAQVGVTPSHYRETCAAEQRPAPAPPHHATRATTTAR